jgi:hypothetical protein
MILRGIRRHFSRAENLENPDLRMADATEGVSVGSITAIPPIYAIDASGQPASVGNLRLGINLALMLGATNLPDGVALKRIDGMRFDSGPVVAGLKSGNPNLLEIAGGTLDANGFSTGASLTLVPKDPMAGGTELRVSAAALDGARQEAVNGVFFLELPQRSQSAIRGRVDVPFAGNLPTSPVARLSLRIIATASGTLPGTAQDGVPFRAPYGVPASTSSSRSATSPRPGNRACRPAAPSLLRRRAPAPPTPYSSCPR